MEASRAGRRQQIDHPLGMVAGSLEQPGCRGAPREKSDSDIEEMTEGFWGIFIPAHTRTPSREVRSEPRKGPGQKHSAGKKKRQKKIGENESAAGRNDLSGFA